MADILPTGYFWLVMYSTILLAICTGVAMVGSLLVSKTALFLFIILTISTLSIPVSTIFEVLYPYRLHVPIYYTLVCPGKHFSKTCILISQVVLLVQYCLQVKKENFTDLFGIFFLQLLVFLRCFYAG